MHIKDNKAAASRDRRRSGRAAIARALEREIAAGGVREGEYLPGVRAIGSRFGCSPLTAHRAVRLLAGSGVVRAEPGLGYRVTAAAAKLPKQETVAFLEEAENYAEYLGDIYQAQMQTLQREAVTRNWTVVLVPYRGQSSAAIVAQLEKIGATALILQDIGRRFPRELFGQLASLGLPVVNLDSTPRGVPGMDHVVRDDMQGATLAAEYLLARGHRRLGWFGPQRGSEDGRRRFTGAFQALLRVGLEGELLKWSSEDVDAAHAYLSRKGRPRAVLALWDAAALNLARAALAMGLKLGTDLDIVGWELEEHYEKNYAAVCPELAASCAAVTWSMADVGRAVLSRIEERRRDPDLPNATVLLPMHLRKDGRREQGP
jgi:DNA-binding LacI/PurR family transcriptional regulator